MHRLVTSVLAALAVALPAFAGDYSDSLGRFKLNAPDGWFQAQSPGEPIALVIGSPRTNETRGNCNVFVGANAMGGKSQAEVNQITGEVVNNETFWKTAIGNVPNFKSTTIEKFGARERDGRKVYFVKATSMVNANGSALTITQLQDLHATPGTTFAVTCTAFTQQFDREASDFEAIMASFEPSNGLTVAWSRAPLSFTAVRSNAGRAANTSAHVGVFGAARRR